jgi:hypothetical protein
MWGGVTSGSPMGEQGPSTHIEEPKLHLLHLSTAKRGQKEEEMKSFFSKRKSKEVYGERKLNMQRTRLQ